MISLRKLLSLPPETRFRKILRLLEEWEPGLRDPASHPPKASASDMATILTLLRESPLPEELIAPLNSLISGLETGPIPESLPWDLNLLRHGLMREIGIETADWDYIDPRSGRLDGSVRRILPCGVYIDGIRSPYNIGSIFRTADCFGVREIRIVPGSASPEHRRAQRTAMGSIGTVPWGYGDLDSLAEEKGIFALELGGTPLGEFVFPREGICIVGSEELGIRPAMRRLAEKNSGIVSIPLLGAKGSLNVSVAFGILMQAWSAAIIRDF